MPLFLAASCGGGGGGGGGSPAPGFAASSVANTQFLIKDAPVDDLLSFSASVNGLRLERADGTFTDGYVGHAVEIEFLGLQDRLAFLATGHVEGGSYRRLHLSFVPGSYKARSTSGSDVSVVSLGNELVVPFDAFGAPVSFNGFRRLDVDLDLRSSLTGSVSSGLSFRPQGEVFFGSSSTTIDEFKGIVREVSGTSLLVDAFVDRDMTVPLGRVIVEVAGAVFFSDDGAMISQETFLASLVPDRTLVEVHGRVTSSGRVAANRVEIEDRDGHDDDGGTSGKRRVEIEGHVVDLVPGVSLELRIREIEEGASIAAPVLSALGSPTAISVAIADARVVFDDGPLGSLDDLALGQKVDVRFSAFVSEPFPAARIEIEDQKGQGKAEGTVTDVAGLADDMPTFVIRLRPNDSAILAGLVASSSTDVTVALGSVPLVLDTKGSPVVANADLVAQLRVQVTGSFSGTPTAPTLTPTSVRVRSGKLEDAAVTGPGDSAAGTFQTTGGSLDDAFGGAYVPGPTRVQLAPNAVFRGVAVTRSQFFSVLANGAPAGFVLEVDVRGLGTDSADLVTAYEVKTDFED